MPALQNDRTSEINAPFQNGLLTFYVCQTLKNEGKTMYRYICLIGTRTKMLRKFPNTYPIEIMWRFLIASLMVGCNILFSVETYYIPLPEPSNYS